MRDWYDRKVNTKVFQPGDVVHVLNLRLYSGWCPKWVRRYADTAMVVKQIEQITYLVHSDQWHVRNKVVHVDKLKLAGSPADMMPFLRSRQRIEGDPEPLEVDTRSLAV